MFLSHFEKSDTVFVFIRFSLPSFVCVRRNQPDNLAFRMTKVEDTHLTLEAIPFYVGVNNSLFSCHYKHTRKNLPSFRSCRIYIYFLANIKQKVGDIRHQKTRNSHKHLWNRIIVIALIAEK